MRISAKGRYALASMIHIAQYSQPGNCVTVISIAERLGISKIYLEQVFSLLKKGGLVSSVKGAQGGYQLNRMPEQITAYDILSQVEITLFETAEDSVKEKAPEIEAAMRLSAFDLLDKSVRDSLQKVSLRDLVQEAERQKAGGNYMFYI